MYMMTDGNGGWQPRKLIQKHPDPTGSCANELITITNKDISQRAQNA
jgi:hypothetical protein